MKIDRGVGSLHTYTWTNTHTNNTILKSVYISSVCEQKKNTRAISISFALAISYHIRSIIIITVFLPCFLDFIFAFVSYSWAISVSNVWVSCWFLYGWCYLIASPLRNESTWWIHVPHIFALAENLVVSMAEIINSMSFLVYAYCPREIKNHIDSTMKQSLHPVL